MRISNQTEEQMIESILAIYSKDEKANMIIAQHIAIKLMERRRLIREARKKVV